jgi:hypothetical protein
MNKVVGGIVVAVLLIAGLSFGVAGGVFGSPDPPATSDTPNVEAADDAAEVAQNESSGSDRSAMELMEQAAKDGKYFFGFFWKDQGEQTSAMKKVFEDAVAQVAEQVSPAVVQVTDTAERQIVREFGLDRAPMPLVLVVAPNGAIMGGFPTEFTEERLLGAMGTRGTERCVKSLQDGKLLFVCVQNDSTELNAESLRGVEDFKADDRYAKFTEIVKLDPTNPTEASFLEQLDMDLKTKVALTAFLAPPGVLVAEFEGATKKDDLISALQRASAACGPSGCGPSGCGPR